MAANQLRSPSLMMGWWPQLIGSSIFNQALNATGTWLAYSFVPDQAKTLSEVSIYLAAIANPGSMATTDLTADIYSSVNGAPGTSLASQNVPSVPTVAGWVRWTGFSLSLSAGVQYWIVLKNNNAAPATNFPTYQWINQGTSAVTGQGAPLGTTSTIAGVPPLFGWSRVLTTNSGTAWTASLTPAVMGIRLGYNDATYDGVPISSYVRPSAAVAADRATGKQGVGAKFNVPANARFNVRGAWMLLARNSTPGAMAFKLYQGTTLLGTSNPIASADITGTAGDIICTYFPSAVTISSANNPHRLLLIDTATGDATTAYVGTAVAVWDADSNSTPLTPMNGTLQETRTTDYTAAPPTFTDVANNVVPFGLFLDTAGEFAAAGGGLLDNPGMAGRMNG